MILLSEVISFQGQGLAMIGNQRSMYFAFQWYFGVFTEMYIFFPQTPAVFSMRSDFVCIIYIHSNSKV